MTINAKSIAALFLICITADALAAYVSESEALKAAESFVTADAIGSSILKGRSIAGASRRDGLWIVALAPNGHVILGGSDLVDPIVGFSENDFAEPVPESPAFTVLEGANASIAEAEAQSTRTRHARWTKLLDKRPRTLLAAADVESPDTIVIPPFLESHYNQWQPYNDYAPVYEASTNNLDAYRGRCPCGCVATAAAQGFRHFRWPARMDRVDFFNHNFTDAGNVAQSFPIRFDGHVPIDWTALEDDYIYYTSVCVTNYYPGGYNWGWQYSNDLRGTVPEATRHPISRLILFADVLAHMSFGSGGSSANYGTVASNSSDWYTQGTWVSPSDTRVQTDIENGVPVQVSIPGHAVVGHGLATDGEEMYIYFNYGWGGSNDGYYAINGSTMQEVYVGHYPRAKPQVDPLPTVCGTSLTLNWHFPDFYTNNLSGFTVSMSRTATTPTTFIDDFSASDGTSSSSDIYITTDSAGDDEALLFVKPTAAGTYSFPGSYTLTSASVLTFRLYSFAALGAVYTVEARFNGEEWTPICTPLLKSDWGASGWSTERIYLGLHGGQMVRFRIRNSHSGSYYPQDESRILLDDFTVTDVLAPLAPEVRSVGKTERSLALDGLVPGASYSFVVTPNISGALVEGESSDPVPTSIAGSRTAPIPGEELSPQISNVLVPSVPPVAWETETLTALGTPKILSVSAVAEGFYGECGTNTSVFTVTCSSTVESLEARPSHLALVSDEDVSVTKTGSGIFRVSVTPSGINEANLRSRMILTLVATDANGTKCYKDLSLRFSDVAQSVSEVIVSAKTSDDVPYSVSIPYSWIEENGLAPSGSDSATHESALSSDADSDGLPNWAEYVCGTSPIDPDDKLTVSIAMEDGRPVVTYSPNDSQLISGFKAVIKGTTDLAAELSEWEVVTETRTSTFRFFRVEVVPE